MRRWNSKFAGELLAWLINHAAAADHRIEEDVKSKGGNNHE